MTEAQSSTLDVSGATLSYDVRGGDGPSGASSTPCRPALTAFAGK